MKPSKIYKFPFSKVDKLKRNSSASSNGIYKAIDVIASSLDCDNYEENIDKDAYPFIPLGYYRILSIAVFLEKYVKDLNESASKFKFLDVGCGIGNVCATILAYTGIRTIGIDLNPNYYNMALKFTSELLLKYNFSNYYYDYAYKEINAFDFNNYEDFDFIYYYCPLERCSKQIKLERLIEEKMKVGALLFPFLMHDENIIKENKKFERYSIQIGHMEETHGSPLKSKEWFVDIRFNVYKKVKA